MASIEIWKKRYQKFLDNPKAIIPFAVKRLYYNHIADKQLPAYENFKYLDFNETITEIIENNRSIVRFGDELFDMLQGIGLYYGDWRQKYDPALAKRMEEVIQSRNPKLLVCFNPHFILKTKEEFEKMGIPDEYYFWTNSKIFLKNYYHPDQVYGNSHCFTEKYNTNIDYDYILNHMSDKHVILMTSNTARFGDFALGKSTDYIEAPKSDAWDEYDRLFKEVLKIATKYQKDELLILISMGSAAKVMTLDLTEIGYTVWDTGQFFDFAFEKFRK